MPPPSFWSRIRKARLFQVLLVYLGVSWLVVQVVSDLRDMLALPAWIGPVTIILLAVGLFIMLATAWVQSHPLVDAREQADEVPRSWELDLGEAVEAVRAGRLPHLTWTRALFGGVVAFSLLIGVAGMYVLTRSDVGVFRASPAVAEAAPDGIAVLPFTVRGAALEDWREGMVDLLSTGLDGAGGLRAIASRTVLARWHESVGASGSVDQEVAFDVARRVGARYALIGSAVAIGPSVRLVVDVHELEGSSARPLGQAQVEGHPDSVLVLVDRLGMQALALVLRQSRSDLPQIDLASVTTSSLPALKSYLEGESLYRRGDFEAAVAAYERATATDSMFALAYVRLSQALGWNESIQSPRGREANERALALSDRLPPRDALLARATMLNRSSDMRGIALLQEAVKKYPDDAEAWYQLGDTYYHQGGALVAWDEIEAAFDRAVTLAPRIAPYRIHLLEGALRQADSVRVRKQLAEMERIAPNSPQTHRYRMAERIAFGSAAERDSTIAAVVALAQPNVGGQINAALTHPRFLDARVQLGRTAYPNTPPDVRKAIARTLGWGHMFNRGQTRAALTWFRDPALEPHEWSEYLLAQVVVGLAVPAEELAAAEAAANPRGPSAYVVGMYAAARGRWGEHNAAVTTLRERADSLASTGDSVAARRTNGNVRLLEGYAVWQRGRPDEAARIMESARADTPDEFGRWLLGRLHLEAGRWREAEPYFRSFMKYEPDPLTAYHLAQIYEATARPGEARAMLAFFVEHWADADPELQPLVADANRRLARLTAERSR
jgi:tetratricopeptide (TPR) repeat protein